MLEDDGLVRLLEERRRRGLTETVQRLAARHHGESAPRGRWHRLVVAAHPTLPAERRTAPSTGTDDATPTTTHDREEPR